MAVSDLDVLQKEFWLFQRRQQKTSSWRYYENGFLPLYIVPGLDLNKHDKIICCFLLLTLKKKKEYKKNTEGNIQMCTNLWLFWNQNLDKFVI